ncbi:MAG: universal stress protein [Neisseriaceae bacterium]|nr:universal stress protein [Neisseriaceae bacterium]
MYQKIMVPVDESHASMRALREACQLASSTQAAVCAIHILDYAQFVWGKDGLQGENGKDTPQDAVLVQAQQIMQQHGIQGETAFLNNTGEKIAHIIVREAAKRGCDLIIMGTHGLTGLMHLLMGSVAEGVLRESKIPVMLIRHAD